VTCICTNIPSCYCSVLLLHTESYKFLEEAIKYSNMPTADAAAHFKAFVAIRDSFIAVNSAFEVNISTSLRNQVRDQISTHQLPAVSSSFMNSISVRLAAVQRYRQALFVVVLPFARTAVVKDDYSIPYT
jgi:hypothetical protein